MAQPLDCRCDAPKGICLRRTEGAETLDETLLSRYWLNEHIDELLAARSNGKDLTQASMISRLIK